jgi:hypothetical protein
MAIISLVFILLPNKHSQTYSGVFQLLLNYCDSLGLKLEPTQIVCDFEKAIHIGVRKIWPNINIMGCRFHLTQSWFRKIQQLGLAQAQKQLFGCWKVVVMDIWFNVFGPC